MPAQAPPTVSTKQQRRTAARKARQKEALAAYKRRFPMAMAYTRLNTPVEITLEAMDQRHKQRLAEGHKTGWRRPRS